jgi:Zn-dependent protease with chaperone function
MKATEFSCRGCGAQNRLSRDGLLQMSQSPVCGRCKTKLLSGYGDPLVRLDPTCYIHDLDRQALEALHQIPGVRTLLRTLLKKSVELSVRLFNQANYVKVSSKQLPQLKAAYEQAAHALGLTELPELFVFHEPRIQAFTEGVEHAMIRVSSGALDILDNKELIAVLAHELGHYQCNHVLYLMAAILIQYFAESLLARMTLGLTNLAILPIELALFRWRRAGELTADRAALLAVREPVVVLRMLMKLAGGNQKIYEQMDFEEFLSQAEEFEEAKDESLIGKGMYYLEMVQTTHPYPMWRACETVRWVQEGAYLPILCGEYPKIPAAAQGVCQVCGQPAPPGSPLCQACLDKEEDPASTDPRGGQDRSESAWDRTMSRLRQFFDS